MDEQHVTSWFSTIKAFILDDFFLSPNFSSIMTWLNDNLPPRLLLLTCLLAMVTASYGQNCSCPLPGQCSPCMGGINSMTLQYNGSVPGLTTIKDGTTVVYFGLLSAGNTITITGPGGDKFVNNQLYAYSPLLNTPIPSDCSLVLDPTFSYGFFTVLRASSEGGGNLCCASGTDTNASPRFTNIPTNITPTADAACTATVTWTPPTVVDCNLETFTSNYKPSDVFPLGTTIVTYTATDEDGASATCSFTVTVKDNSKPVLTTGTPDVSVQADANCMGNATWIPPVFSDNCTLTLTSTHAPGSMFPMGTTNVTYTAKDGQGNTTTYTFKVVVKDLTGPVASNCPSNIIVNVVAGCEVAVSWTPPVFTDSCTPVSVTSSHAPNTLFSVGSPTTVTYTAKDSYNNTTVCSFTVTIKDEIIPGMDNCPADIVVESSPNCTAMVNWSPPVFTDNCGLKSVTPSHTTGYSFPIGKTEVTYTAIDYSGNKIECKFNVTVKDLYAPVFTNCPADINVSTSNTNGQAYADWSPPLASDECSLASLTSSHEPGSSFPIGSTTVTYTAKDSFGNTTQCSFKVNVVWETVSLDITQLVTPDGNGENDTWIIGNIQQYENNKVTIVDRWGNVIYSTNQYDNELKVWTGQNNNGNTVPTGTYFYTITTYAGPNVIEKRGFIEVVN